MLKQIASRFCPSPSIWVSLAALVIALGGAGYAANGGSFILGATNEATSRTLLSAAPNAPALYIQNLGTSTSATALQLRVALDKPPLRVNSSVKVPALNADYVDGLSASAFARAASEGWRYIGDSGEPAFENGWSNLQSSRNGPFQNAGYRIDQNGVVHLTGLITGGALDQPAFSLSGQYCPYYFHPYLVLSDDGTARPSSQIGRVDIIFYDDGDDCKVRITEGNPSQFVSLEGISYLTAARDAPTNVSASAGR